MAIAWTNEGFTDLPDVSPVPVEQVICAADFDQVDEWRSCPPAPTAKAKEANRLFYRLLRDLSPSS